MSRNRDEVSAKLGQLLLKGHKMLADSCPKCHNVLMQDKKGIILCVACNETVTSTPSGMNVTSSSMEVDQQKPGNKTVPERGSSTEIVGHCPTTAAYASEVLLQEIKAVVNDFERNSYDACRSNREDFLVDRKQKVEYIIQCAGAIKSLQEIRM